MGGVSLVDVSLRCRVTGCECDDVLAGHDDHGALPRAELVHAGLQPDRRRRLIVDEQTPSPQDESPIDGGPIDAQTREAAEIEEVSSVIARLRQATEAEDVEDPKEINESNFVNADTEGPRTVLEQNALASGASFPPFMCSPEAQVDGDNPKSHITGHVDFDIRTKA